ncbi:hypothetical protein MNL13_03885 [Bartonella krasnovii]|uniref:Major tropism determinant second domain-containing protein n=1 Tax=Bartonella krasnovii TaxID=2267275 RepID=A0ABY3VX32_9HYPH|nr:hypothetical protein [Bartonella krasnovii]UNF29899.1 hypothetical protein MNL13_03885 [Bartonella krasnovii]UNF36260.1 hypothetical protein MNL12_03885 [Bartonella krasnovii]UNF49504.1 hypothetical protein MNL04_04165 [Bartonella krasnovii]
MAETASEEAQETADIAKRTAEEAKKKAGTAETRASEAKNEAEKAKQLANSAKSTADSAKSLTEQTKQSLNTTNQELGAVKRSLATVTATANSTKSAVTVAQTEVSQTKALTQDINTLLKHSNLSILSVSSPFLVASGKKQVTLKQGTYIALNFNNVSWLRYPNEKRIDIPQTLSPGKDYYLYLAYDAGNNQEKFVLSVNATYPDGYTANNSGKIGGFHALCADVGTISGHSLSGYRAGDILPNSVWCLNHRPHSSPEGMVYDPSTDMWVDIYLQSGIGENTKSVYRTNIITNRSYTDHATDMARVKKSLLSDEAFASAMYGSNDKRSIQGKKSPSPKHSGGHKDTANRRMISYIGCEDGCGYIWQFLSGSIFFSTEGNAGTKAMVAGGSWNNEEESHRFSRGSIAINGGNEQVSARGCSRSRRFV